MKWLTHNLPLKLASLLLALGFWVFVAVEVDNDVSQSLSTTAQVRGLPADLTVLDPSALGVALSFHTKGRLAGRLKGQDVQVWVDGSLLTRPGQSARLVVQARVPFGRDLRVAPATVWVKVDHLAVRALPMRVDLWGKSPPDVMVGEVTLSPSQVTVSGPETLLGRMKGVAVALDRGTLALSQSLTLIPRLEGLAAQEAARLSLSPPQVGVTAQVLPRQPVKLTPVSVLTRGQPPPGWRLAALKSDPPALRLVGPVTRLRALAFAPTQAIDLTNRRENFTALVPLNLPPGVGVLGPQAVSVSVGLEAVFPSRQFKAPVPLTWGATRPATLTVTAWGPPVALQRLGEADFEVKLQKPTKGWAAVSVSPAPGGGVVHAQAAPGRVRLLE